MPKASSRTHAKPAPAPASPSRSRTAAPEDTVAPPLKAPDTEAPPRRSARTASRASAAVALPAVTEARKARSNKSAPAAGKSSKPTTSSGRASRSTATSRKTATTPSSSPAKPKRAASKPRAAPRPRRPAAGSRPGTPGAAADVMDVEPADPVVIATAQASVAIAKLPMVKPGDLPLPTRPTAAGTTLIMGNGDCGQLGLGEDIKSRYKYAFVKAIKDQRVVHVACGGMHSLALCENGKVFSWGCNDDGALGREVPDGEECDVAEIPLLATLNVVKLACGDSISLALTGDGLIYGWGTFKGTETSQIGFSDGVNKATSPVLMTGTVFSSNRFVDVAAGNNHALALTSQGKVFSWGNTEHGQCGFKTHRPVSALNPRGLNFSHHKAIAVACGGDHSLVVDVEGDVWTFGLNNNGQCGSHPSNLVLHTPVVLLKPDPKVRAVAAAGGDHFSAVLLEDGHVLTFGKAADGQLGLGDLINLDADQNLTAERFYVDITAPDGEELRQEIPAHVYRAAVVPALHDIKAIAVGSNHAFAIDAHGVAWRWGFNEMGQCGTGDSANDEEATEDVTTPIPIDMSRSKSTVVAVAAGAQHSVIVANIPNTTPDAPVPEIQVNGGVDANGVDGDASSSSDPVAAPPLPAASQEPMDTTA